MGTCHDEICSRKFLNRIKLTTGISLKKAHYGLYYSSIYAAVSKAMSLMKNTWVLQNVCTLGKRCQNACYFHSLPFFVALTGIYEL